MKAGNINALQAHKYYPDGTQILVKSIFGVDYVEIVASGGVLIPSCKVSLYDQDGNLLHLPPPKVVPPTMWYPPGEETFTKVGDVWEIRTPSGDLEVLGVDYQKTYFRWTKTDCPSCGSLILTVAEGEDAWILTGSSPNRPFTYKSENDDGSLIYNYNGAMVPHFMGYTTDLGVVIPEDPTNHTIYSFWKCQAQILELSPGKFSDSDSGGTYFLWKAYTEWSNVGPWPVDFSLTGLGYMLMKGTISNQGIVLCETEPTIIKVDCCEKAVDRRHVNLWWESLDAHMKGGPTCGDQPFMFYGSMVVCEVPDEVSGWYALLCTGPGRGAKYFYTLPDIEGSCIPFIWTKDSDNFELIPAVPFGETATLMYSTWPCISTEDPGWCNIGVTVTVEDRCGTKDHVKFLSCCEALGETPMYMIYTSLHVMCGSSQDLTAVGGCSPFTWVLSGGGTLVADNGNVAVYTAPTSNVGCAESPGVITVTDCCGQSTSVTITANCFTQNDTAYVITQLVQGGCFMAQPPSCLQGYYQCKEIHISTWNCLGVMLSDCQWGDIPSCEYSYQYVSMWTPWACGECGHVTTDCMSESCGCGGRGYGNCPCNTTIDVRTVAMKNAGCCPINPNTGMPF
jgi:hypothetical protein